MKNTLPDLIHLLTRNPQVKYASFTYHSKGTGEISRVVVLLNQTLEEIYWLDIEQLEAMWEVLKNRDGLERTACDQIIRSRCDSIQFGIGNNPAYTCKDVYIHSPHLPGLRIHKATGELYVCGMVQSKVVLVSGEYKDVKSRPLTLAKKEIEKQLPSGKFRTYILRRIERIDVDGETLKLDVVYT